jgi:radical SAM superfamily enzyme YgiQ (UPF0313 family)/ferredoxin
MLYAPGEEEMKVKLIYSPFLLDIEHLPPLAIAQLAAALRQDKVVVDVDDLHVRCLHHDGSKKPIDLAIFNEKKLVHDFLVTDRKDDKLLAHTRRLMELTDLEGYDLIGFSVKDHSLYPALVIAKLLKEKAMTKIVLGGTCLNTHDILSTYPFIDFAVTGDGEPAMRKLCSALQGKAQLQEVPGLTYRWQDSVVSNDVSHLPLESQPMPDFDGLPLSLYSNGTPVLPYVLNKGCRGRCAFCWGLSSKQDWVHRLHYKPFDKVIAELSTLKKKYGTRYFFFLSSEINLSYEYVDKLCDAIICADLDILWCDCARPDLFDAELLIKMRKAGCIKLVFGIESGSDGVLKRMYKGFTVDVAQKVIRLSHEAGIWNYANFIAGYPHESIDDVRATVDFIERNADFIDEIQAGPLTIIWDTALYVHPEKFNIRLRDELRNQAFGPADIYAFDEIGGLDWATKQRQQEASTSIVNKTWLSHAGTNTVPVEQVFIRFDKLGDKKAVRQQLKNMGTPQSTDKEWRLLEKLHAKETIVDNIDVTLACNNRCLMCSTLFDDQQAVPDRPIEELVGSLSPNAGTVILTGGEPTISKDFFPLLRAIREKLPQTVIEVQTNGRTFYYESWAQRLAKHGNVRARVSLYAADRGLHEKIAQVDSFDQTVQGTKNLLAHNVPTSIIVIIHKLNYRNLPEIASFISSEFGGVDAVFFRPMLIMRNAYRNKESLIVSLSDVRPFLEKALDRLGNLAQVIQVPLCCLGQKYWHQVHQVRRDCEITFEGCEKCTVAGSCSGIDKTYRHNVGAEEFRPFLTCPDELFCKENKHEVRQTYQLDEKLCIRCASCQGVCPTAAITLKEPSIDPFRCAACGACVEVCPQGAISNTEASGAVFREHHLPEEDKIMAEVERKFGARSMEDLDNEFIRRAYRDLALVKKSIEVAKRGIEASDSPFFWKMLGTAYHLDGKYNSYLDCMQTLVGKDPSPENWLSLSFAYRALGDIETSNNINYNLSKVEDSYKKNGPPNLGRSTIASLLKDA